jgi:uncharacterized membrane protein YgaE (UPF0421/DUF939 family)
MNEFYALLIVGVWISSLVVFILLSQDYSTDIQSVTRNIKNGKSVYEIELVKNKNQYFDLIVDPSVDNVAKINDTL